MPTTEVQVSSLFFPQVTSGWHRVHEGPAGQGERGPADCQGWLPYTCWDQEAQGAGEGQNEGTGKADRRFSRWTEDVWNMKAQCHGVWHWKSKVQHALTFLSAICCCSNINASCFWILIIHPSSIPARTCSGSRGILIMLLKFCFINFLLLQTRFYFELYPDKGQAVHFH